MDRITRVREWMKMIAVEYIKVGGLGNAFA